MTAGLYHVNPETGNPNKCRAKRKCPFGGEKTHYTTPEAAREAYEVEASASGLSALKGLRLSKGARLVFALGRAQEAISRRENEGDIGDLIQHRNTLMRRLEHELPWDHSDEPVFDDSETVELLTPTFEGGEKRRGFSNSWWDAVQENRTRELEIYRQLDEAGAVWLKRLSTAEVRALVEYNKSADEYAKKMAGEEGGLPDEAITYFHSALAKAPRASKSVTVYAGISRERCLEVRAQCEKGELDLARVQSASANPAQVNGFMFQSDWKGPNDETAVEFTIDRVATLSSFHVHRGEMEVLVAPGVYTVEEKFHHVDYLWGRDPGDTKEVGRTAETTYRVRPKEPTTD